jgi:NAD(P)-dependent dehydrogenase (short-subunit alcohol dehydrogenase family)
MIAEGFHEEGADVLVADLCGGDVEVDVRDASLVARAVDTVVERLGGLDTLVYNAGVVPSGGIEDLGLEVWRDVMRINVDGAFTTARAAWPHLWPHLRMAAARFSRQPPVPEFER